jgi:hypothetical protein
MAFDAGAVIARIILDDSEFKDGAQEVKKGTGSMAKSFIAAELAVQAFNKILKFTIDSVKKGIQTATKFTEENNKLNVVFSDIKDSANIMRKELVDSFGLSTTKATELLGATGDLLTGFGFTQESALALSGNVQKLAVDLASFTNFSGGAEGASQALTKALLGERESLKSLGISISEADVQTRLAEKGLKNLTGESLRQAKAQATLELATEQAKNAIGDFERSTGTLVNNQKRLQATTEDIQLVFGKALLPVINDVTAAALNSATSFKNMILSGQGIDVLSKTIASFTAGLEVGKDIIAGFGNILKEDVLEIVDIVIDGFKELTGGLKGNISAFDILGGVVEFIGINLSIVVKIVKTFITGLVDMIIIIKDAVTALVLFGQAIFQPKKWKEVGTQIKEVGSSIKKFGTDAIGNITELVTSTIDEFAKLPENAKTQSKKMEETWTEAFEKTEDSVKGSINDIVSANQEATVNILGNIEKVPTAWEMAVAKMKETSQKMQEGFDNIGKKIIDNFTFVFSSVSAIFNDIFDLVTTQMENELVELEEKNAIELEELQLQKENRLLNFEEEILKEEEVLNAKKEKDLISQEQFDIALTALQKKKSDEKTKIEKEENEKIEAQKRKAEEKRNKKEQEIFNANKANQIANIWINFAVGVVGLWAQSLTQLGPIAGSILAGVLTAALLGVAIAQTVVISQQQFIPSRQLGGATGGPTRINEAGGEIVNLPDGSVVVPNDISRQIAMNAGSMMGGTIINVSFAGAKISDDMSLRKISNFVIRDMAKQLRLQT